MRKRTVLSIVLAMLAGVVALVVASAAAAPAPGASFWARSADSLRSFDSQADDARASAAAAPPAPGACFWARSADSFRSIDNRIVYIRASARDVYELKLFAPCLDVDWSHRIALRSRASSWICEGTGNAVDIIVRSTAHRQTCPVTSVRRLTPEDVAALPAAARP